jgi:uncharacterized protein (DUF697 family)
MRAWINSVVKKNMRTKAQARSEANVIVVKWAAVAGPIGIIPGAPLALPAVDAKLIHDVARCYEVTNYAVDTVLAVVGATIAGRTAADIGLTNIPIAGWIVKGFVAAGTTYAVGKILCNYFEERSPLA